MSQPLQSTTKLQTENTQIHVYVHPDAFGYKLTLDAFFPKDPSKAEELHKDIVGFLESKGWKQSR